MQNKICTGRSLQQTILLPNKFRWTEDRGPAPLQRGDKRSPSLSSTLIAFGCPFSARSSRRLAKYRAAARERRLLLLVLGSLTPKSSVHWTSSVVVAAKRGHNIWDHMCAEDSILATDDKWRVHRRWRSARKGDGMEMIIMLQRRRLVQLSRSSFQAMLFGDKRSAERFISNCVLFNRSKGRKRCLSSIRNHGYYHWPWIMIDYACDLKMHFSRKSHKSLTGKTNKEKKTATNPHEPVN